jgi:hypothetical protein
LDEEFPEFQKLLDAMEEEVPPITLPILSPLGPVQTAPLPTSLGQKRSVALERADMEDTGASGSGGPPAKQTATDNTGTGTTEDALEQDATEGDELPTHSEAITAFIGSPHIPEPNRLRIDHISVLMGILSHDNGPAQKYAVKLLSMEYDPAIAELIWQAWSTNMSPPAGHLLAVGTLARDLVLATLTKLFPTATQARTGAKALTDALVDLISTHTFVDHTVQDLEEETEMEVLHTSPSFFPTLTGQIALTNNTTTLPAPPFKASSRRRELASWTHPARTRREGGLSPGDGQPNYVVGIERGHTQLTMRHLPLLLPIP